MIQRKRLAPNNQQVTPSVLGVRQFAKFPKSIEQQSIVTWAGPGRGQQGESVSGGSNRSKNTSQSTNRAN